MGLASMLNERGIKGVTPSAINTPAGPNFSPTVTPCNSPGSYLDTFLWSTAITIIHSCPADGSPTRDRSPEPALFSGLFSSGADMLRRKLVGPADITDRPSRMSARNQVLLSRQEKRALRSLRLLEKVESIGLDNMMPSGHSFTAQQRGISPLAASSGFRNRTASPMTQLTSLKTGAGHNHNLYGGGGSSDEENTRSAAFRSALSVSESLHSLSDSEGSTTSSSAAVAPAKTSVPAPLRRPTSIAVTKTETPAKDKTTSPTEARLKQMQRQKSRRALVNGQRPDLGTVGGKVRPDLGRVAPPAAANVAADYEEPAPMTQQHQTMTQSFVGTLSSLFFGRKGGLL